MDQEHKIYDGGGTLNGEATESHFSGLLSPTPGSKWRMGDHFVEPISVNMFDDGDFDHEGSFAVVASNEEELEENLENLNLILQIVGGVLGGMF